MVFFLGVTRNHAKKENTRRRPFPTADEPALQQGCSEPQRERAEQDGSIVERHGSFVIKRTGDVFEVEKVNARGKIPKGVLGGAPSLQEARNLIDDIRAGV